jgi:hypothetical protein
MAHVTYGSPATTNNAFWSPLQLQLVLSSKRPASDSRVWLVIVGVPSPGETTQVGV